MNPTNPSAAAEGAGGVSRREGGDGIHRIHVNPPSAGSRPSRIWTSSKCTAGICAPRESVSRAPVQSAPLRAVKKPRDGVTPALLTHMNSWRVRADRLERIRGTGTGTGTGTVRVRVPHAREQLARPRSQTRKDPPASLQPSGLSLPPAAAPDPVESQEAGRSNPSDDRGRKSGRLSMVAWRETRSMSLFRSADSSAPCGAWDGAPPL